MNCDKCHEHTDISVPYIIGNMYFLLCKDCQYEAFADIVGINTYD